MNITIVDGGPNAVAVGIQLAFLCVIVGGVVAAAVAVTLVTRTWWTAASWPSTWHTPFTFALVLQACSLILAVPLFVAGAFLSTELWIPGLLLVNVLWAGLGVVCWRSLRLAVAATMPPSIIEHRRAG